MSLAYTEKDICKLFAQNPCMEQIRVLSELNDCREIEILNVIHSYGLKIPKKKNPGAELQERKKDTVIKNDFLIEQAKKRRAKLEFLCLSLPERQKEFFDEMQDLRLFLDSCA